MADAYRELKSVHYGENGLKLNQYSASAGSMCFPAHWHNRIELLLIVSGSLNLHLDDQKFTAGPGQAVVITPSVVHCGFSGEAGVCYYVIAVDVEKFCNATVASSKYIDPILKQEIGFSALISNREVIGAVEELILSLKQPSPHASLYSVGKTYELISLLYEHCTSSAAGQSKKPDESFGAVLKYINSHYTENISSKDVSQKFGYDETYFCRRFKKSTGITTMSYIRMLRLELAQKLLKETNESICNISWKCGFADTHYFSNCFKKHFGTSPTEFRKLNAN